MSDALFSRRPWVLYSLSALVMVAFAANSVLARLALRTTEIDAATFATVRLLSGALALGLLVTWRAQKLPALAGSWTSAGALFVYAAAFSFAYVGLETGVGALLLFGAVQLTMIGYGFLRGERFSPLQLFGFAAALGGFVYLLLPGLAAPPLGAALLMTLAGAAWGMYSLRGRGADDPLAATAGNFVRSVPLALALSLLLAPSFGNALRPDALGVLYAALSGALTSGLGYALWYAVLPSLRATSAATVQLSVPLLAALGGVVAVAEPLTPRLLLAAAAILGGIAAVLRAR